MVTTTAPRVGTVTRMASLIRQSLTTERGIWAIKWSFVILAITAALQIVVVLASGSIALLADTIHNVGRRDDRHPLVDCL